MYSYKKYDKDRNIGFFQRVWNFLQRKFPTRPVISYKKGVVTQRQITTRAQLTFIILTTLFIGWSFYSSYMFLGYRPLLKSADEKVAKAEAQYSKILQEIVAYKDNVSTLNDRLDKSNTALLEKLEKNSTISKEDKYKMVKNHQMLTAELDYVNKKLSQFASEQKFADINANSDYYKSKNMEIQRDIAWQERAQVKKRNAELEDALVVMLEANRNLFDKIEVLATNELGKLEKDFSKIKRTMDSLGLSNKKTLLKKLEKEEYVGGPFIPLEEKELKNYELNGKYQDLTEKVNLWEGLSKLKGVLPLGSPVSNSRITSSYGVRRDPFTGQSASHQGIDFAGQIGTPLTSVNNGIVKKVGNRGAYGNVVEIDHGMGFTTLFAHLERAAVKVNDVVREGQIIGYAGNTGRSTGPHLHYEIRYNGNPINPYNFYMTKFESK